MESLINVVDGESMDESRTFLLASIGIFCLFVETISNEKEHGKSINELMPHFNNMFSKSNQKSASLELISKNQYHVLQTM